MATKPRVALAPEVQAVCDQITHAHVAEQPPFLPVTDKQFIRCSNALNPLLGDHGYRDTASRQLPLPSSILPPPL